MKKGLVSRSARFVREGFRNGCGRVAKTCGAKSFPLFGIPCGLTSGVGEGEGAKNVLYPVTPQAVRAPQTIEKKIDSRFEPMLKGIVFPEEGLLTLPGGIATSKGGNLTAKGRLAATFLQTLDGKPPHDHDLFRFCTKKFFPRIYRAEEPVITLTACWQGAFYHWMYEVLPRLHLIDKGGHQTHKIYAEAASAFQKQSLELLGIAHEQLINAQEYAAVSAPQLIIPSIPVMPTVWACQFLREKFIPKLSKRAPLRLYVSRNDATRRRILNENEVMELLKMYGFEKAELSGLSFKEQAELFHAAEAVVGPHGAGFSHVVFCQPNTPFLEIFNPTYIHTCYWHISNRVGLNYHYLFGEGERYPDGDPDIVVDIQKLKAALELMCLS